MANSREDRSQFIEVTAAGQLKPSAGLSLKLSENPGLWRLLPEVGQLLVLERLVDNRYLAKSKAGREIRIAGVFDNVSDLASILNLVHMSRWDGVFHVCSEQVRKALFFRRGVYLAGRSNLTRDRLGHVLVRVGMLTPEQRDECIAELADGSRLGTVLVSRGYLTTPKVYEGLRRQAEEIFYSVLRFGRGTFRLVQPLDMTEVPAMLRLDLEELLLEGMRRLDEETASGQVEELQRSAPIPGRLLPADAVTRIVDTYNDALSRLFGAIGDDERATLAAELTRFLGESAPYRQLFDGVVVAAGGTLFGDFEGNLGRISAGDPLILLQHGLSELLFFIMFAAGDALEPDVEQVIQRDVARALASLPKGSR